MVGLKPTYGRVSRYGLIAYGSSLDCLGPLTSSVEDAAIMLTVMAGTMLLLNSPNQCFVWCRVQLRLPIKHLLLLELMEWN